MARLHDSTVEELIKRSLDSSFEADDEMGNPKSIASWDAIGALADRADEEVIGAVHRLLGSGDPWHRARGANILGRFQERSRPSERLAALLITLETEDDDRTLTSLIHSISHLHDPRTLAKLLTFVQHPNREVRRAVAMALQAEWGDKAVAALCRLCSDEWAGVRDWAAFSFRTSNVDSDEIRRCLMARLHDPEPEIRAEVICALARRHDLACLEQLVNDLGNLDEWDDYYCHIEAAHHLIGCGAEDERSPEELRAELICIYSLA